VGRGRHYDLHHRRSAPLENLEWFDCVLIVTDHSLYNYGEIVEQSRLVIDTRNATRSIDSSKIVRC
jgi:UDP-N-acetyl-D-glucosamine dehydrogenase